MPQSNDNGLPSGFVFKDQSGGSPTGLPPGFVFKDAPTPAPTQSSSPASAPGLPPGFVFPQSTPGAQPQEDDSKKAWYEKAWSWANTPLVNFNSENEGGFWGGTKDVASGLTSPLSLGLTALTFGGGSLLEALGLTTKSAAALALEESGMTSAAAAAKLSSMGVAATESPLVIRGMKSLLDAGFTGQALYQVAQESPRFLDALKEGDTDAAGRLAAHILAGSGFAYLGGRQLGHDAGGLMEDINEKLGFKVKPSAENLKVRQNGGIYQADVTQASTEAKNMEESWRKQFKGMTPEDREATMYLMQGGSPEKLTERYNLLAQAAGREDQMIGEKPEPAQASLQPTTAFRGTHFSPVEATDGTIAGNNRGVTAVGEEKARLQYPNKVPGVYTYREGTTAEPGIGNRPFKYNLTGDKAIADISGAQKPLWEGAYTKAKDSYLAAGDSDTEANLKALNDAEAAIRDAGFNGYENKAYRPGTAFLFGDQKVSKPAESWQPQDVVSHIKANKPFALLSAEKSNLTPDQNATQQAALVADLKQRGYEPIPIQGVYKGTTENSFFVPDLPNAEAAELGRKYNQESVLTKDGLRLLDKDNPIKDAVVPADNGRILTGNKAKAQDNYSVVKTANGQELPIHIPLNMDYWGKLSRYQELAARGDLANSYKPEELDRLLNAYRKAINPTPEMSTLAKQARDLFSADLERAAVKGVIKQGVKDYATQIWEKPEDNPAANTLLAEASRGGFHTNVSMARQRVFENAFEGQLLGRKLAVTDPISLAANYHNKIGEAIAARDFMERLRDNHVRASDNRPMVALSGTGQLVEGEDGQAPAVLVNPSTIRNIQIANKVITGLKQSGDFDRFLADGKLIQSGTPEKPTYYWNTHDYRTIDHPAFRDWNYATHAPDGTPIMVKGELRVHPQAYDYLNKFIGAEGSPIKQMAPLNTLLKAGTEAKQAMLSMSPFHVAQEGLRAIMTGINPIGFEKIDLASDPVLRRGVEAGLTLGKDYHTVQDYEEGVSSSGHSKLISRIPIIRDVQNNLNHFLFDKYIPSLKVRSFRSLVERYDDMAKASDGTYKEGWSFDRVNREAAADTNERFGGLNYRQMGRAAGTQDFLRLATLAPDWLESELRFAKRLVSPNGGIARQDFVRMAAIMWGTARVLNYLASGKPHNEAPFGVALTGDDGKEKVYSIRTLPTDLFHMASDPAGFLRGRVSPLVRAGDEALTQRDYAGRKQSGFETISDITRNMLPIPIQSVSKGLTGQSVDMTTPDQIVKAAGGTAQVYRTQAEQKAIELASNHTEQGPVDPAKMIEHQIKIRLEDEVRAGTMPPTVVHQLVENGQLSIKDGKEIIKNAEQTRGMKPEMATLWSRASRLPMKDFLDVWETADNEEKAGLTPLLLKKKQSFFKTAQKDMTPQQRLQDPTYRRLRSLFPTSAPW